MAFVCKSEKPSFVPQRDTVPGPGYYPSNTGFKTGHGYAPFGSTAQKNPQPKKNAPKLPPGPGAYNLPSSFQERNNKVCYSTLSRHQVAVVENANMTTNFKSKVRRFESQERDTSPGPGAYENKDSIVRRYSFNQVAPSYSNVIVDKIIEQNKKGVASIPSHVNRYGYSEDQNHNLIPNKNPLFELQKYVGPGYYQAQELFGANKSKGLAWDRSNSKRFDATELKKATSRIGPGCYEIEVKAAPAYQNKPTVSFASKIEREPSKEKKSPKKRSGSVPPKRANSMLSDALPNDHSYLFAEQFKDEIEELEALQEMANIAPGPGQYHNERLTSSIKTGYKPPRLQFFGSSTERFPNKEPSATTIGPGEYQDRNKSAPPKKGKTSIPFSVSKPRFEKEAYDAIPGPGAYDGKKTILDRIKDKEKSGYIGSFGMTDKRFKEVPTTVATPDPGLYHAKTEAFPVEEKSDTASSQKPNQSFQSKVPRETNKVKKDKIPPPGAYDLGYYDIGKKVNKDASNENRPPFNVASSRFKAPKVQEAVVDEEDEMFESPRVRSTSSPAPKKPKMNAVFASQTQKTYEPLAVNNNMPGPGYYARSTVTSWVKKTHNINFMQE